MKASSLCECEMSDVAASQPTSWPAVHPDWVSTAVCAKLTCSSRGINPLPFHQNNKPTATKEEVISYPEKHNYLFSHFLGPVEGHPNVVYRFETGVMTYSTEEKSQLPGSCVCIDCGFRSREAMGGKEEEERAECKDDFYFAVTHDITSMLRASERVRRAPCEFPRSVVYRKNNTLHRECA
ncbi:uncharacterized protein V6R79_008601 [Siganus canaliculatus]